MYSEVSCPGVGEGVFLSSEVPCLEGFLYSDALATEVSSFPLQIFKHMVFTKHEKLFYLPQ